ncbi:MAG: class I SAM-dependent methyltransferase, partial [Chlorobiales bacterium]|nr:class I SAM-dependent methyltransferase [Chlorobiales bacterium]
MQEKSSWSSTERFNQVAETWDEKPMRVAIAKAVAQAILNHVPLNNDMTAMEFGCGTGLISLELSATLKEIVALDTSEQMINVLRRKITEQNIPNMTTICADLTETPKALSGGKQFHLIYSSMTLHHVMDTEKILTELKRFLLPGGYLAIADLDEEDGTFHDDATENVHHGFEREELRLRLEKAGYHNIRFETAHVIRKQNRLGEVK